MLETLAQLGELLGGVGAAGSAASRDLARDPEPTRIRHEIETIEGIMPHWMAMAGGDPPPTA